MNVKRWALYGGLGGMLLAANQTGFADADQKFGAAIGGAVVGAFLMGVAAIVRNKFVD